MFNFKDLTTSYWRVGKSGTNEFFVQDQIASGTPFILDFQSNGAGVVSAVNGSLTLSTLAGNGNIVVTPNGTGSIIANSVINLIGNGGVPSTTTTFYMAGGYSSPVIGRIFIGDGTGYSAYMSKRNSSVTTDLFQFADSGTFSILAGNFSVSGNVTGGTWQGTIIAPTYGGTGVAYFQVAGPTALRTYTFPDASSTMARTINSLLTGSSTSYTITHNWGHVNIVASLQEVSTGNVVIADVSFPTVNTCVIAFLPPRAAISIALLSVAHKKFTRKRL